MGYRLRLSHAPHLALADGVQTTPHSHAPHLVLADGVKTDGVQTMPLTLYWLMGYRLRPSHAPHLALADGVQTMPHSHAPHLVLADGVQTTPPSHAPHLVLADGVGLEEELEAAADLQHVAVEVPLQTHLMGYRLRPLPRPSPCTD